MLLQRLMVIATLILVWHVSGDPMSSDIDIRQALRAFQTITENGEKREGEYHLSGLRAFTDFDGYTATICNDSVRLDIYFHNKYLFDFSNLKEKTVFLEKLKALDQRD